MRTTFSRTALFAALAAAALAGPSTGHAQSIAAVKASVDKALQVNPEVSARLNAFLSQGEAVTVAESGLKPKLDLSADGGINRTNDAGASAQTLKRLGIGLTLTQMLWDGLATRNEVGRANHERLARWFEFVDASEKTALEAARGLYDVQRQRRLVQLAEENVAHHREATTKIDSRAKAGVGRGVDLDQVRARLALAESNLETEQANLHDVSARYQRIVGDPPPEAGALQLLPGLPASASTALQATLARHPALHASIEGVRAARAAEAVQKSALQPRVEARANLGVGHNYNGVADRRSEAGVGVVMNWNLYNGGATSARVRQQFNEVKRAMDQRDSVCRDVRQTLQIAYNDAAKLGNQITLLQRNTQAIERAREAYLQQFDIGQRSLIDVLNAENETYTARRSLINAEFDRAVAHARVLAATNQLNVQLGIARDSAPGEARDWNAGDDAAGRCMAQPLDTATLRGSPAPADNAQAASGAAASASAAAQAAAAALAKPAAAAASRVAQASPVVEGTAQAAELPPMPSAVSRARPARARAAALPAGATATTDAAATTPAQIAAAAPPAAGRSSRSPTLPPALSTAIQARLDTWAKAQRSRDFDTYADLYVPDFAGDEPTPQHWQGKQARQFLKRGPANVKLAGFSAAELPDGQVETRFRQVADGKDVDKVLTWKIQDGQWRITREANL